MAGAVPRFLTVRAEFGVDDGQPVRTLSITRLRVAASASGAAADGRHHEDRRARRHAAGRARVRDPRDVEHILQDVFSALESEKCERF
jgi:hypothetical protein